MSFGMIIKEFAEAPFSRHLMLELLQGYKRPNDKIHELIKSGELLSIKRGLYIPGPNTDLSTPDPFLIANHLRGPSYVSLESALSYWGGIPEHVYEISSVTTKPSKKYNTPVGRFVYQQLPSTYYSFGVRSVEISPKQTFLIASPEKAICDKIILTPSINLRSVKETLAFLLEDLRIDDEFLENLDSNTISSWIVNAPKKSSLKILVKTLDKL